MIDSGATEDFIDKGFCNQYNIRTTQAKTIREVYLADGRPSAMGPMTDTAKVPVDIGSHTELAIFQVAKLRNHEVILGMPWLKQHSPRIDRGQGKITVESERCTTWCLKESPTVYAIPEDEAREENFKVEFGVGQSKKDQRARVKKLDPQGKIPTRGSAQAAGHDLYANESKTIPARGQEVVRTQISITPPRGTYSRIGPRSGMALKHQIAVNAGVIGSDYTGEIKVVLANMGNQDYRVKNGDRIAQLIAEKIVERDCYQVRTLKKTNREQPAFGSTGTSKAQICEITARAFGKFYRRPDTTTGILKYSKKEGHISLESVNISTELAIKSGKYQKQRKLEETVPQEYHEYLDVFEEGEKSKLPPHGPGVDLEIKLEEGEGIPIKKIYALSQDELKELWGYIKQNEERRWIRETYSEEGSPIMFVKKKDGKLRLCVNYRALNHVTKKDRYPLPLIGEALDRLQTAKYYTKLDIQDAYHNVTIKKGDEWKKTFTTKYGTYEYLVMPFGLTNAPAAFQRWMNRTLQSYIDICCIVFLDDVLIYSDNQEQHQKDVAAIIRAIRQQGMKLKRSKCEFHQRETEYLGFIINNEGVKVDLIKTAAIWDWKTPTNKKGIKEFMGFCNFCRRFVNGFSRTAKPLYDRTKKDVIWEWGNKEQTAFDELRQKLCSTPVLTYFKAGRPVLVETDASQYVCSGILSQQDEDGKWKPIGYRSKTMKPAESYYDVHDKERLAIVQALKEWRRYLKGSGQHCRVLTDNQNLIRFTTTKELTGRQIRWSEVLSGFDFKIEYRPGKEGGKPDALTRRKADMPQDGDERLTQQERILLPKEKYFETSIQEMETIRREETSYEELHNKAAQNEEIEMIRKPLE